MTTQTSALLRHLHAAGVLHHTRQPTDGQLLERFVNGREEAALEALVHRHAPMVWGVCRRILRNHHDAEDAFQAAFLVLVRKAASISPRERVGNWLYGVAHQTARKVRATTAKLRTRERRVANLPEPVVKEVDRDDLRDILDLELSRLPEKYRAALVLCDLEGMTRKEAARQLGVPEGTLAAQVARARTMLAKRLARHGLGLSAGVLAGVLAQEAEAASVPFAVRSITLQLAKQVASGLGTSGVAAPVASLTEGVLHAMRMTKLRFLLGIGLVSAALMLGSVLGYRAAAADRPATEPTQDRLADTLILLDKQLWEASSRHDADTVSRLLADDYVEATPDGPRGGWNKARCLEYCRQTRTTDVTFLKERRVIRLDEHTARMSYELKWRTADKGREPRPEWHHAYFVNCWVQRDGGWFIKCAEGVNLPVPSEWLMPAIKLKAPDTTLRVSPAWSAPGTFDFAFPSMPTPAPTAWKKGVRASSVWTEEFTPEKAFDGDKRTVWASGGYAPAWIERDLGASRPLASITLITNQSPPCETVHEVWVSDEPIGNDRSKARLVHTFKGWTEDGQVLKFDFPKNLSARYVEILTTASESWVSWTEIEIRVCEEKVVPLVPNAVH